MIYYYTGVPGSGKSYHIAREIYKALRNGKNVISNVDIDISKIRPKKNKSLGAFIFVPDKEWLNNSIRKIDRFGHIKPCNDVFSGVEGLKGFARNFHNEKDEGQTLLIFDECHKIWNSRSWNRADRLDWCDFHAEHRHYGFDEILSSQDDKKIDKQIKGLLQTQVLHRSLRHFKLLGKLLAILIFGGNCFICIESLYGMSKKNNHIRSYIISGDNFYFSLYNSYTRSIGKLI